MHLPIISSPTLKEQFVETIETMILSGELKIGEKLPTERELSKQLQISKSVVHEGMIELERKGFIQTFPRQKSIVCDYKSTGTIDILISIMKNEDVNHEYIYATLELRNLFMHFALEKAIPKLSQAHFKELERICEYFEKTKTIQEAVDCCYQFDQRLMEYSGNSILVMLFSSFQKPNRAMLERYFTKYGIAKMHLRNCMLLQYIKQKDVKKAQEIMTHSIEETMRGKTTIYE